MEVQREYTTPIYTYTMRKGGAISLGEDEISKHLIGQQEGEFHREMRTPTTLHTMYRYYGAKEELEEGG